jgi:uncharacterized protein YhaN
MRLLDLRLEKYGPFTDHVLDLKGETLQIIFGPNEAGKSSTLRAITCFLYGFPARTSDDHVHVQRSLRVGAQVQQGDLTGADDSSVILYRKKGNKDTLRSASDEVVEDGTLAGLLNHLPKDQFVTFFGLDNKILVEGGEDLIKGQGNLGEALFSASMGGQQFQQLLKDIDTRQGELFKSTGSNPKLNAVFKVLRDTEKLHKEHCLKSTDWEKFRRAVDDAREVLASVETQYIDTRLEKERLERIKRTLPNLSSRADVVEKLAEIENVKILPHDSTEIRLSAITETSRCQPVIEQLEEDIQGLNEDLGAITINESVLALDVSIDSLKNEKALYKKNTNDYQLLLNKIAAKNNDIDTIVATILPANAIKNPDELILTAVTRQALGALVEEGEEIALELADIETKSRENDEVLTEAREKLAELPESVVMGDLELAIKDAERTLVIAQEVDQFKRQVRELQEKMTTTASRLGLTSLSEEQQLVLQIPSHQKISEMKIAYDKLVDEKDRELIQLKTYNADKLTLETQQKEANVGGQLITENDLTVARQDRETLWSEIKDAWIDQTDKKVSIDKETKTSEYEAKVGAADQHADRLRREADRLAEYGVREIQLENLNNERDELQEKLSLIDSNIETTTQAWKRLWSAEVESVGSYAEMSEWEKNFRELQAHITEKAKLKSAIEDKSPAIIESKGFLISVLLQAGESKTDNKSLASLVDQATGLLSRLSQCKEDRQSHETRKTDAKKQTTKLSQARDKTNLRKDNWSQRWEDKVVVLEVPKKSTISDVNTQLSQFDKLADAINEHRELKNKQDNLGAQITGFEDSVTKLKSDCGMGNEDVYEPLMKLYYLEEELKAATDNKIKRQKVCADIKKNQDTHHDEKLRLSTAQEQLNGLFQLAGCETVEELETIETENHRRLDLKKDLVRIDSTLEVEPYPIEALKAEAENINIDELTLLIEKTIDELDDLEQKRKQAIEDSATAKREFEAIENKAGAVSAAEDVESALAQIDVHYREYCMLAITRQLLSEQIECYRESNQGPILSLAEDYFQRISLGRYSRLVTQYNDKDEPELYCLRGDREVPIDGLSEGTRDQLFFSLRLASIVNYFDTHEPIPLVIDDIMMTFDNERSLVAFEILGEIAKKTQVLYFTHHSHHKDLAKLALNGNCVFHELPPVETKRKRGQI